LRIKVVRVKEALTPSGLPDIDWALNPYVGCSHACTYCYGRTYARDEEVASSWGEVVAVKENIVSLLRYEVRRKKLGVVGVGTVTDAYQPIELDYELTKNSLKILLGSGFSVSIQTKSDLVLRDKELLSKYKSRVDVGVTITTMNSDIAKFLEPNAPSPKARARVLEQLSSLGISTWVFLGPIVPGYTDDLKGIREVIEVAANTRSALYYDKLRVKDFMLKPEHPLYHAAKKALRYRWGDLFKIITDLCRRYGVRCSLGLDYSESGSGEAKSVVRLDEFAKK